MEFAEIERLGVDDHQFLFDAERVRGARKPVLHRGHRNSLPGMKLGYDGKLYILAFDHRGSFQKKMFGIQGDPTPEETERIADAKHLIFEGMLKAVEEGAEPGATGVLVDEQFGGDIPAQAKEKGLVLSMPVEKSGQNEFDFEYGDQFGEHIESSTPTSPRCSCATTRTATPR